MSTTEGFYSPIPPGLRLTIPLFNRRLIKSAVKVFRFNHIDNDMGILLPHEMHNVVHLIGGHHGVKQIHFLVTVTSHRVHTGYAVSVLFDVLVYDFRRLGGGNLQCNPFIPVMEGRDGFGGRTGTGWNILRTAIRTCIRRCRESRSCLQIHIPMWTFLSYWKHTGQ